MSSFNFSDFNFNSSGVVRSSDELFACDDGSGKLQPFPFAQESPAGSFYDSLHGPLQDFAAAPSAGVISVYESLAPAWRPRPMVYGWSESMNLGMPEASTGGAEQTVLGADVVEGNKRKRGSETEDEETTMGTPDRKKGKGKVAPLPKATTRRGRSRKVEAEKWTQQEEGAEKSSGGGSGEHDDPFRYLSSSLSSASWIPSSSSASPEATNDRDSDEDTSKEDRKGKGKASTQRSAAHALAQITKFCGKVPQEGPFPLCDAKEESPESSSPEARGEKKRRNGRVPPPTPVPNLVKTSRGRKVPYVVEVSEAQAGASVAKVERASKEEDDDKAKKRTFVCEVAGCGKCFVRGEHLKRHIRSIHTYEKPYACPACGKSFSRRDNLGQHVRLHVGQLANLGYIL